MKRHQKPRPIRDASRMGGTQIAPGGIIERPAAVSVVERDARLPDVQAADPHRLPLQEGKGGEQIKVRVCKRDGCGQEIDK